MLTRLFVCYSGCQELFCAVVRFRVVVCDFEINVEADDVKQGSEEVLACGRNNKSGFLDGIHVW